MVWAKPPILALQASRSTLAGNSGLPGGAPGAGAGLSVAEDLAEKFLGARVLGVAEEVLRIA